MAFRIKPGLWPENLAACRLKNLRDELGWRGFGESRAAKREHCNSNE